MRHKAIIIGGGRIGAGWNWLDDAATHAGAYLALGDRVELVGFVEPDEWRAKAAWMKWGKPVAKRISDFDDFDIASVCVQPEQQAGVLAQLAGVKGVLCEKPYVSHNVHFSVPVQVNFMRRADPLHRRIAERKAGVRLIAYGYDNLTTRCHFDDLAKFWGVPLEYRKYDGPCSYILETNTGGSHWFDNGGVNSAECFKGMLGNLMDAMEGKADLFSPPYVEEYL